MRKLTRLLLVATLLFGCVGCDQATKNYARTQLSPGISSSYMRDTVRIIYAENVGAFVSVGESFPKPVRTAMFQGVVGLIVIGLLVAALSWRGLTKPQVVAFVLIAANGLGNLIDRLVYDGRVTDFLNLGIGALRTGIFNVADIFGVVGVILLLLHRVGTPPNNPVER